MFVSESFYTVQGEGKRLGTPSYFLRLAGCNLHCGFDVKDLPYITQSNLESYKKGNWICDTVGVWKSGKKINDPSSFLREEWERYKYTNLVITGGEPLMQTEDLREMLTKITDWYRGTVEVETNGTLSPSRIKTFVNNFNVSPKLYLGKNFQINKDWYNMYDSFVIWKFVVSSKEDVEKVVNWSKNQSINSDMIYLMPASENREQLIGKSKEVVEWSKEFGFNMTTRLQILIWDKLTGV